MPLIRNTLDCCICLYPVEKQKNSGFTQLFQELQDAKKPPCGGFVRLRMEESDRPTLYANHQGGYRVFCPHCSANIARSFSRSVEVWRQGSARTISCDFCKERFFLEEAIAKPAFAFARAAIILCDVNNASLGPEWISRCDFLLEEYRIVYRRVG